MKRSLIFIILIGITIPCHAQWVQDPGNTQVVAFATHDTSIFYSGDHWMVRDFPLGFADTGLDFRYGNYTTFASIGKNFFAGSYDSRDEGNGERTTNNGSSWTLVIGGPIGSNGTYVFGHYAHHLAISTDGDTFQHLTYPDGTGYVGTGKVVYMCTSEYWQTNPMYGFLRSMDSGYTWTKLDTQPPFLGTLFMMGTLLFMYGPYLEGSATPPPYPLGAFVVSRDSGVTWDTVNVDSAGTPEYVVAAATDGKNLFVAGANSIFQDGGHRFNGVYVSTDTGRTWHVANDGLKDQTVEAIAVTFDTMLNVSVSSSIPFSTYHRSIRNILDSTKSGVRSVASIVADSIEIFPNPANGMITILAGGASILGVRTLNMLGEQASSMPVRGTELQLDISKFPSGTYFLQIQTANGFVLRKFVKE